MLHGVHIPCSSSNYCPPSLEPILPAAYTLRHSGLTLHSPLSPLPVPAAVQLLTAEATKLNNGIIKS